MSYSKVEVQFLKQTDKFAAVKQLYASVSEGTTFWRLADAANDETYENRVKNSNLTNMDINFSDGNLGTVATTWINDHNNYFNSVLGIANVPTYLEDKHLRVNQDFAEVYFEALDTRLDPALIFPDGTKEENQLATMTCLAGPTYSKTIGGSATGTTKTLNTNFGDTRFGFKVDEAISGGTKELSLDFTLGNASGDTFSFSDIVIDGDATTAGLTYVIGECSFTADAGDTSITVTIPSSPVDYSAMDLADMGYSVGSYVVLSRPVGYTYSAGVNTDDTDEQTTFDTVEYALITAVDETENSITLSAALRHHYIAGSKVAPTFNKVTAFLESATGVSDATSGSVTLLPVNDRSATLTP